MMIKSKVWIEKLELIPHPEGGYFKEVYRAEEKFNFDPENSQYNSVRNFSTSIYYLLEGNQFSAFHKLASDEIWHFYYGCPVQLHLIDESGNYKNVLVGNNIEEGNFLQYTVKHGIWFAAKPIDESSYSLVGCTVSPGFDFNDFVMGERTKLVAQFPKHKQLIEEFTIK